MTEFYRDEWLTILQGDVREVLPTLPADSVDCIVTSPPYWGLRDYGNDGQIGLERTPEEYVANMVGVFRELRRVLKASGTCWLNLGDSYTRAQTGNVPQTKWKAVEFPEHSKAGSSDGAVGRSERPGSRAGGLKDKDLVGIPWRVAFALQADGWYLRSEIIWSKPNPMPESVTDRPTKSHEQLFLLAKGQWKSRVVDLSNSDRKRRHLRDDFGPEGAYSWAGELGVRLATAILDSPELKENLRLSSLDTKVGEKGADSSNGEKVLSLPVEHRATELASRLLSADCSAEQFFSELYGLGITLADRHNLLIGGSPAKVALPPGVYSYGETSVAIHHPGEVREFDFLHNRIIASAPSTCSYYFDSDAVAEASTYGPESGQKEVAKGVFGGKWAEPLDGMRNDGSFRAIRPTRNIRSVWTIATRPYPGAHFAVFPPELPERCIKAGSCERGVCSECGAPWERVVSLGAVQSTGGGPGRARPESGVIQDLGDYNSGQFIQHEHITTGWRPTCGCSREAGATDLVGGYVAPVLSGDERSNTGRAPILPTSRDIATADARASNPSDPQPAVEEGVARRRNASRLQESGSLPPLLGMVTKPAVVLDPFAGSGTTGMVANRLSRRAILIDLNASYLRQQMERNAQTPLGLGAA